MTDDLSTPETAPAGVPVAVGFLLVAAIAVCVVVSSGSGTARAPEEFSYIVVGICLAIALKRSLLVAAFCGFVIAHFVLGPVLLARVDSTYDASTPWIVVEWLGAIVAGSVVVRGAGAVRRVHESRGVSVVHWWMVSIVVAIQAALALGGRSGYSAQIATGITTPTGLNGTLSALAPTFVLALAAVQLGTGRRISPRLAILVFVEIAILVATGFRGAGIGFLIASVVLYTVVVRPRVSRVGVFRGIAIVSLAVVAGVVVFNAAAGVKSRAAAAQGASNSGTQLWATGTISKNLGSRLDLVTSAEAGISAADRGVALPGLGWRDQFLAAVPRAVWAGKPTVTYGGDVAHYVFGQTSNRTSSTVGTLGDAWINGGLVGVLGVGLLIGAFLGSLEDRLRRGQVPSLVFVLIAVASTEVIGNDEIPFGLIAVNGLRAALVVGFAWAFADIVALSSERSRTRKGGDPVETRVSR